MKYRLNEPFLEGKEKEYTKEVLDSRWLSVRGKHTIVFEKKFAQTTGVKYALAVQSGTAAIHTAVMALGLGKGDKVIVPNYTCAGSIVGIIQCQAEPVILDVEPDTFALDAGLVKKYIKKIRPKALVAVHVYGFPARDTEELSKLCSKHGVILIEDSAEALGAKVRNKPVGSFGDIAAFSIRSEKMIGVGEGGVIATNNPKLLNRALYWVSRAAPYRTHKDPYWKTYKYTGAGMNYLLPHLLGAVARAQIENFGEILRRKKAVGRRYQRLLSGCKGLRLQKVLKNHSPVFWLNMVVLEDFTKDQVRRLGNKLLKAGVEIRPAFWPLSDLKPFKSMGYGSQKIAKDLFYKGLVLPSSVYLADNNCKKVDEVVEIFLSKLKEIS